MRQFPFWRALAPAVLAAGLLSSAHGQAVVQDVDNFATYARSYNLIAFGNAAFNNSSDTDGGIAVGGNVSVGGSWTFAGHTGSGSDPSFYVAGQITGMSGTSQLNNGFAAAPASSGTWDGTGKNFNVGGGTLHMNSSDPNAANSPLTNPTPSNWSFSAASSAFSSISSDLAAQAATGTIGVDGGQNLVFSTAVTSGVAVFTLDASLLSGSTYNGQNFSSIAINVPSGVNYVVNVINLTSGQTIFGGGNFNSGSNDNQLLWNFVGSGTVNISNGGNFYGSVLAPGMTVNDSTTIDGQVVAQNFTDNGVELHYAQFTPEATAVLVPEPRWYVAAAAALCAAGAGAIRLRRNRIPA